MGRLTFQKGDRVVYVGCNVHPQPGTVGTIVDYWETDTPLVKFDDWKDGHGDNDDEWYVEEDDLVLDGDDEVQPTFEIGDVLRKRAGEDFADVPYIVDHYEIESGEFFVHVLDTVTKEVSGGWYEHRFEPFSYRVGDSVRLKTNIPGLDWGKGYTGKVLRVSDLTITLDHPEQRGPWYVEEYNIEFITDEVAKPTPKPSKPSKVTPGAELVLKHMQSRGSISPVEAFASYGTLRLAARIHELREAGWDIVTDMREDASKHRYGRYSLAEV